jgi:putative addiction module component (TIGR02574 family)
LPNNRFERLQAVALLSVGGIDDEDKSASLDVGEAPRRSTSLLAVILVRRCTLTLPLVILADMARPLSIIQEEIRELSVSDKETLLRVLWEELDGPPDPAVEAEWLEEVQRRSREIDEGLVECIPAEEVFARLEALIKK